MTFKPIRYNRRQVTLMVTVATFFNPNFASRAGEASTIVSMIAAGLMAPTPKILEAFNLRKDGRGYLWNPL